jgi:hypothetical protein
MIRAISEASGEDAATALGKIGVRTCRSARPRENKEEMRTRERLATLHPDETNVGDKKL